MPTKQGNYNLASVAVTSSVAHPLLKGVAVHRHLAEDGMGRTCWKSNTPAHSKPASECPQAVAQTTATIITEFGRLLCYSSTRKSREYQLPPIGTQLAFTSLLKGGSLCGECVLLCLSFPSTAVRLSYKVLAASNGWATS